MQIAPNLIGTEMKIQDIKNTQLMYNQKIQDISKRIDIKLLSILTYQDLFNEKYDDSNSINEQYLEYVLPVINEYKNEMKRMSTEFLIEYVNDMSNILENTGYYSSTFEEAFKITSLNDYNPCIEIEPVFNGVYELISNYTFLPFWRKPSYYLKGDNESVLIYACDNPTEFFKFNRGKFIRSNGDKNIDLLYNALLLKDKFEYKINIEPLTTSEDRNIPTNFHDSIRRHLILKHAKENSSTLINTMYKSSIDKDGNITFHDQGYYY